MRMVPYTVLCTVLLTLPKVHSFALPTGPTGPTRLTSNELLREIFKRTTPGVSWPRDANPSEDAVARFQEVLRPVEYPEYYARSFHCYDRGNMCWDAAIDVSAANDAVLDGRSEEIRAAFVNETVSYMKRRGLRPEMDAIVDVGCGCGISTAYAARLDLCANVTGVDLSPYFLAMTSDDHQYVHANAECTPLEAGTFDAATISFVLHELPGQASEKVLMEASRLLRRGGVLAILDMGAHIQASGLTKRIIFSRTEPYLEEFMAFTSQLKDVLHYAGFVGFETVAVAEKHTAYFAFKGASPAVKTPGLEDRLTRIVTRRRNAKTRRVVHSVANVGFLGVEIAVAAFLALQIAEIVRILTNR